MDAKIESDSRTPQRGVPTKKQRIDPTSSLQIPGRDGALRRPRADEKVDDESRSWHRAVVTKRDPTKPVRKRLPHDVPLWVDPSKEKYFITGCCKQRGKNQIATPDIGYGILETIKYRHARGIWYAHVAVLMPDHVHLILSFPQTEKRMQTIVSKWKERTAKSFGTEWQRDFFEHRLRNDENFREKADYVLANPVRAGLVEKPEDWPYVFIADPW